MNPSVVRRFAKGTCIFSVLTLRTFLLSSSRYFDAAGPLIQFCPNCSQMLFVLIGVSFSHPRFLFVLLLKLFTDLFRSANLSRRVFPLVVFCFYKGQKIKPWYFIKLLDLDSRFRIKHSRDLFPEICCTAVNHQNQPSLPVIRDSKGLKRGIHIHGHLLPARQSSSIFST